ncbi:MAG: hypothetical protein M5U28_24425 [Sandaracinaceae bacterium]|nr:hypothetical protein [Sandaracinaceae bacterium]
MFLFLPIGHDQPVYDRPWITIGLILLCSGIFVGSCVYSVPAMGELEAAARSIDDISLRYPDARVSFTVEGSRRASTGPSALWSICARSARRAWATRSSRRRCCAS